MPIKLERSAAKLPSLWSDLAKADGAVAYRAIWCVAATPKEAVEFLRKRLQPIQDVDPERIQRLIADLDSDKFSTREKAENDLAALGDSAESALREALAGQPSSEVSLRIRLLLRKLVQPDNPERMRELRAIEVLELIGTPEAQDVLKRLARGAKGAQMTQAAKASLDRLAKR
jgi:HEAT repeat protein